MTSLVYIAFQDNDSARYIVEAITQDNPHAQVQHQPAMIRVQAEAPGNPPRHGGRNDRP